LSSNVNEDDIYTIIDAVEKGESNTSFVVEGLEFVRGVVFSEEEGSRSNVPHILVVVTDNLPSELVRV